MLKFKFRSRGLLFVGIVFSAIVLLTACGGMAEKENRDEVKPSEETINNNKNSEEVGEVEEKNELENNEGTGDSDSFIVTTTAMTDFVELLNAISVLDYTTIKDHHNRIEWLGEDEFEGAKVNKYYIISNDDMGSREFEAWLDGDLTLLYFEDRDGSNNPLVGTENIIKRIFYPLITFDDMSRPGFASGDVEIVDHKKEAGTIDSYDVTIHKIHTMNTAFDTEMEQVVAEHNLFEVFLEGNILNSEYGFDEKFNVNELKFR